MGAVPRQKPVPDKLFYKIGEVSKLTKVEPYVLRYWETEFSFLKPRKNRSGQRIYVKKDIETIANIQRLLYQEKYTIAGVRKRLGGEPSPRMADTSAPVVSDEVRKRLENVKRGLRSLLGRLERPL